MNEMKTGANKKWKIGVAAGLFLLISFFFNQCIENEHSITIQGNLKDQVQSTAVENANITLLVNEMVNGSWSTNFVEKGTITSDASGNFKFTIPFQYTTAYRLIITKEGYFSETTELPADELEDDFYEGDFGLNPEASLSIHVINSFPFDNQDQINFHLSNWEANYPGCCPNSFIQFTGEQVNETLTCKVIGGLTYTIEYIITRNGNQHVLLKEVFCPAFESTTCEILY